MNWDQSLKEGRWLSGFSFNEWWMTHTKKWEKLVPRKEGNIFHLKQADICSALSTSLTKWNQYNSYSSVKPEMIWSYGIKKWTLTLTMRQISTSYRWWLILCFNITLFTIGIKIWYCVEKKKRKRRKFLRVLQLPWSLFDAGEVYWMSAVLKSEFRYHLPKWLATARLHDQKVHMVATCCLGGL